MLDTLIAQLHELWAALLSNRGFHGFVGFLLFIVLIICFYQLPATIRSSHLIWFFELLLEPFIIVISAFLFERILVTFGISLSAESLSPIYTIPLILILVHLYNRAFALFIWRGVLSSIAHSVPLIVLNIFYALTYIIAFYVILTYVFQQSMTGVIVSSGVMLGILGLSFQPILGDVIAGIGLAVDRPFSTGDWVELENGIMGEVIATDWRATGIRTINNTVHVVPNSKLANASIHNFDRPDSIYGFSFFVTVSRTVDPGLVRRLLLESALKAKLVLDSPAPIVRTWEADSQPIRYMVRIHCVNYRTHYAAKEEVLNNSWELFNKSGFNFSYITQETELRKGKEQKVKNLEIVSILEEVSLLRPLNRAEKISLVKEGIYHKLSPAETIIKEGDSGNSMFIIISGMVNIQKNIDKGRIMNVARLGTSEYFGEMSLMTGEKRSASVLAHTECYLLEISKQSINPIIERRPEVINEIAEIMAERKTKSELLTSKASKKSLTHRLRSHTDAFSKSIRAFFQR